MEKIDNEHKNEYYVLVWEENIEQSEENENVYEDENIIFSIHKLVLLEPKEKLKYLIQEEMDISSTI